MTTIGIDCDGVMADLVGRVIERVNAKYGKDFKHEDINTWDVYEPLGISKGEFYSMANEEGFCADLNPLPGARAGIDQLRKHADVYAVTSPMSGPYWLYERTTWLIQRMGFQYKNIIQCKEKTLIKVNYLVDDKTSTINAWAEAHPGAQAILWNTPWNAKETMHMRAFRASNWVEVLNLVAGCRRDG